MIIYIYGEDSFRSRQYLKEQVAKFKTARDPQGYNVVFVNAKTAEPGKVLSEIAAAPFLSEKRMVILENVLSSSDKELLGELIERVGNCHAEFISASFKSNDNGKILKQVQDDKAITGRGFPQSNIIVFYQSEALSKVKEAKELDALLRKEKYAKNFEPLIGAQLLAWINGEVKNRGGKISGAAGQYLAQNIGGDMWHLDTVIDQLAAYTHSPLPPSLQRGKISPSFQEGVPPQACLAARRAGRELPKSREIQLADVQLFLDEKLDDNIFNLTDAIAGGNRKLAFKLLDGQRKLGEDDAKIFGTIIWQFRTLMSMRDLFEREDIARSDELAKKLKIHPFVAKKNWAAVKKYSSEKLRAVYRQLLDIDIKTKTGLADQSMLLDLFVGKI